MRFKPNIILGFKTFYSKKTQTLPKFLDNMAVARKLFRLLKWVHERKTIVKLLKRQRKNYEDEDEVDLTYSKSQKRKLIF